MEREPRTRRSTPLRPEHNCGTRDPHSQMLRQGGRSAIAVRNLDLFEPRQPKAALANHETRGSAVRHGSKVLLWSPDRGDWNSEPIVNIAGRTKLHDCP